MHQPSLFDSPESAENRLSVNPDKIRRELLAVLKLMRASAGLPWKAAEARKQEREFPALAKLLPPGEAEVLIAEFAKEFRRLNAA